MPIARELLHNIAQDFKSCIKFEGGKWCVTANMADVAVKQAGFYQPLIDSWFYEGGTQVDQELYQLANRLNSISPKEALPSDHFCYALIAGQLLNLHTPMSTIAAITSHFDQDLASVITVTGVEMRQQLGESPEWLRIDFRNETLPFKSRKRWLDTNGLWGKDLENYVLQHDDPGAAEVFIYGAGEDNLASRLFTMSSKSCPLVRQFLFGQKEAPPDEILRRLEVALSNTNPDRDYLREIDFIPIFPDGFVEQNQERIDDILDQFARWGTDNPLNRRLLGALDEAGFNWLRFLHEKTSEKEVADAPIGSPDYFRKCMVLCAHHMVANPQFSAVLKCLEAHYPVMSIIENIHSDDVLLALYRHTGHQALLREISNAESLDKTLEDDLGL
jgi:hypothetical protein